MPSAPYQLAEPSPATQSAAPEPVEAVAGTPQTATLPDAASEPSTELKQQLFEAFGPQADAEQAAAGRVRDAQGRFAPKGGAAPTAEPAPAEAAAETHVEPSKIQTPVISEPWMLAAKDLYFTDAEIQAFPNEQALQDAVIGRQVRNARRMQPAAQPAPQTAAQPVVSRETGPAAAVQAALEDLKLTIPDGELSEEMTGPLRTVEQYVNRLKATVVAENTELRTKVAQLEGVVQQSAESARSVQIENVAREWDQLAESVPGMVEAMGRLSYARANPESPEGMRWQMIQPVVRTITERYAQVLGPERIDLAVMRKIAQEAFVQAGFGPLPSRNGKPAARPVGPGSVVASAPRASVLPEAGAVGDDEYDRALTAVAQSWQRGGRNPFAE